MSASWHLKHEVHGNKPWAVQKEALKRSNGADKYGYFLEQGLGKTALTLNEFIDQDDTDIHLVLAPQSFKMDWVLSTHEWGVGWMPTGMWPNDPVPVDADYCQYAVNFEAARNPNSALRELLDLTKRRRVMTTIDESLCLGTPGTLTTKNFLEICKSSTKVRLLNGTPMAENNMNYYGQLRCLGEFDRWTATNFKARYTEKGGYKGKQIMGNRNNEELAKVLDRVSFRATKDEWRKDLPPKVRTPVHLEMTKRQRAHYQTMMEEFYALVNDVEVSAELVLTQMEKLRQIGSCMLIKEGETHFFEEPKNNPKLIATREIVESCPGKVILVHSYKASGDVLMNEMERIGANPARIRGGMKPHELIDEKARFNDDSSCRAIVCMQPATYRGHTLIGKTGRRNRCSTMIFYENAFSYYQRSQMEDRNHRGEQDETCDVFDLITCPIDQTTVDSLTTKRDGAMTMDKIVAAVRSRSW